jgi:hypothetical protein
MRDLLSIGTSRGCEMIGVGVGLGLSGYRLNPPGALPVLDLQFSSLKTLTAATGPTPSFSRASSGTYFDSAGVLQTASTNGARFDHTYNGTSWVSRGLLVEEQRTNLALRSSELGNATWTAFNTTATDNSALSPNGANNASKVVPNTTNATHYHFQNITVTAASYTVSFYAKAAGYNFVQFSTGLTVDYVNFDLANGLVGNKSAGIVLATSIDPVGSGWYRCSVTFTGSNSTSDFGVSILNADTASRRPSFAGDGTSGILIYGFQMELGSFQTSHIPTTSASATRSADVCQITGSDFSSFWNASEGSFAVEYDSLPPSGLASWYGYPFQASNGGSTHRMMVGNDSQNNQQLWLVQDSVGQSIISSGSFFSNAGGKLSCCYKINDLAMSVNGSAVVTDLSQGISSLINQIRIGDANDGATNRNINGHISRLRYYPTRLTNATLQSLST